MKKTKYMMSDGLAFSEEKDMEKLRKKSLQGWNVKDFKFMGYGLERGEKEDVIYSIDYRSLANDEADEYMEYFSAAGWTHVCSEVNMHLFKAAPDTAPIYSEKDSKKEKYRAGEKLVYGLAAFLILVSFFLLVVNKYAAGTLQTIANIGFIIFLAITIPAIMTALAISFRKWRV
ncbi:DUF2812 domain-containing protein [Bacillus sp. FJAT-27251]|uniref:DUF2812 domain-containing protein n=1 Tax=Bacillus sp. FJAT-27251 TaxID=1684142 RepID=UPI0006A7E0E7|nr:DUF2812 domain-containing protein [Bacillus sp. FJAT-27251]